MLHSQFHEPLAVRDPPINADTVVVASQLLSDNPAGMGVPDGLLDRQVHHHLKGIIVRAWAEAVSQRVLERASSIYLAVSGGWE